MDNYFLGFAMYLPFMGDLDNIDEVKGYLAYVDEFIIWCESKLL